MNHTRMTSLVFAVLATMLGSARTARAQSADAMREIQEIATKVDEQLREIDRLLLESSKKNQARSKPKELLEQAKQRSEAAEGGIDQLIEKLQQMKKQSGSSSGQEEQEQSQDQQQQQQQGQQQRQQQQQGQQNRRENQTPDFVKQPPQPGEQEGQQQGQQPQGQKPGEQPQPQGQKPGEQPQEQLGPDGKPLGGQETKDGGQNRTGNRSPNDPTGPGNPGQGEGSWGELQSYVNFLKNKGSAPKVPEKYRKYWEAYLKQKQGTGSGTGR